MMEVSGKRVQTGNDYCVPCQTGGILRRPDGYCKDCEECMCHKCFQHHLKSKFCRSHVLSSLDEKSTTLPQTKQEEKCSKHKAETIKFYCRKHDFVGCGDCMIPDHGSCKHVTISNIAKQFEQNTDYKDITRKIQNWVDENTESEKQIEKCKRENQSSRDTALNEIRKFRKEINSYIDKIELEIVAEAEKIAKANEMQLAKVEKKIAFVENEISDIKDKIDSNAYQDDSLFIRFVECKPGLKKIEQIVSEIKAMDSITLVVFEAEQNLKDLMKSGLKLGRLLPNKDEMKTLKTTVADRVVDPVAAQSKEKRPSTAEVDKPSSNAEIDQEFAQKPTYLPPDPRAAGFQVGKRVYTWARTRYRDWKMEGTVKTVDPAGYITVKWDDGKTTRESVPGSGLYMWK